MMNIIKRLLHDFVKGYADSRKTALIKQIKGLQEDLGSEDRSTAGDKHETGRAMMQLELEKLGNGLKEAEILQQEIQKIPFPGQVSTIITRGSLVSCEGGWYYLSISAGVFKHQDIAYYCVSPQSPIGLQLMGKTTGDRISVPAGIFTIKGVY
ncbi:MAG: hypothetical protein RLZZ241_2342 [Bacteroidota bacterium]|jgi:hypothetical protein